MTAKQLMREADTHLGRANDLLDDAVSLLRMAGLKSAAGMLGLYTVEIGHSRAMLCTVFKAPELRPFLARLDALFPQYELYGVRLRENGDELVVSAQATVEVIAEAKADLALWLASPEGATARDRWKDLSLVVLTNPT